MARTTLTLLTAAALCLGAVGLMITRAVVLGDELTVPNGPGTWKVTLLVHGTMTGSSARLMTATPLDFGRQHVLRESCRSTELQDKPPDSRHPDRRQVIWTQRAGINPGPFRARYEFFCSVDVRRPTSPMTKLAKSLYAAPKPGEDLAAEPLVQSDNPQIIATARELTADRPRVEDQVEALFRFVDKEIVNEPSLGGTGASAVECLRERSGDGAAQSRLLVALCRSRDIPARLVTGLNLNRADDKLAHHWAEAWVHDRWKPMCPLHHHFGQVPATYLVFGFGDLPIIREQNVKDHSHAFQVERAAGEDEEASVAVGPPSRLKQLFRHFSLSALPPTEQRLVEFLLLLPIAALIVCVYRNLVGLISFGTFAPALLGLAFRDLHTIEGLFVFCGILLLGWTMRRGLDAYHLLQVPRTAFLLSLVVLVLIGAIVAANFRELSATKYIPLFPMVILTGMIERFWTLDVEDGTVASFKTLLTTMLIAGTIALVLSIPGVTKHMMRFPETLGLIMACQLGIGRYTGYRLSELFRFRDFVKHAEQTGGPWLAEDLATSGAE